MAWRIWRKALGEHKVRFGKGTRLPGGVGDRGDARGNFGAVDRNCNRTVRSRSQVEMRP